MAGEIFKRNTRSRTANGRPSPRALVLADAGAKGRVLTPAETKEVCEALRAQSYSVRNHFFGAY